MVEELEFLKITTPRQNETTPPQNFWEKKNFFIHLDEETLLSENAVCGILNFCLDGTHKLQ
uniref:Uncharacterized protein n=1 Tax=Romanomermis culicivorax TaxID=13658 RepID=A0A915JFL2_ROMCU